MNKPFIKLMTAWVYSKINAVWVILEIIGILVITLAVIIVCLNIKLIAIWIIVKLTISITQIWFVYESMWLGWKIIMFLILITLLCIYWWYTTL